MSAQPDTCGKCWNCTWSKRFLIQNNNTDWCLKQIWNRCLSRLSWLLSMWTNGFTPSSSWTTQLLTLSLKKLCRFQTHMCQQHRKSQNIISCNIFEETLVAIQASARSFFSSPHVILYHYLKTWSKACLPEKVLTKVFWLHFISNKAVLLST